MIHKVKQNFDLKNIQLLRHRHLQAMVALLILALDILYQIEYAPGCLILLRRQILHRSPL